MESIGPNEIREVTTRFICEELVPSEEAELTDATPLITGGLLDSMSTINPVGHLEESFGIELNGRDITREGLHAGR